MVKSAMKRTKNKKLKRILDARQLALKLVANVSYGYTAANWSGRMPCAECMILKDIVLCVKTLVALCEASEVARKV